MRLFELKTSTILILLPILVVVVHISITLTSSSGSITLKNKKTEKEDQIIESGPSYVDSLIDPFEEQPACLLLSQLA